jgi:hypothetical protein
MGATMVPVAAVAAAPAAGVSTRIEPTCKREGMRARRAC